MFNIIKTPIIEFLCQKEDWGVIPKPYPARKLIPQWYKDLPMKLGDGKGIQQSTIKRCPPFLDAMQMGWIIPLAAEIDIQINNDASGVTYKWSDGKTMIENHSLEQLSSEKNRHPSFPKPPMKFMNYWAIKVPKGWSVLFTPPFNRVDPRFSCITGLVDCDKYFEYINFPFIWNEPNFHGILPAGTPLVQVIPIKRDNLQMDCTVREFNTGEYDQLTKTRNQRWVHESHYRDNLWEKK